MAQPEALTVQFLCICFFLQFPQFRDSPRAQLQSSSGPKPQMWGEGAVFIPLGMRAFVLVPTGQLLGRQHPYRRRR